MIKILFVCLGNICRSPMAEFVMRELAAKQGRQDIYIESAATSDEELGNPVYPPARRKLSEHGIDCKNKRARQIRPSDYNSFDYIIGMDRSNKRALLSFFNGDPQGKISLLMEHTNDNRDVADPWYTGDFEKTWQDVSLGCACLLNEL